MANVYFTWFGPPATANKKVEGVEGNVRPDVFGLLKVANSTFTDDPPPRVTLCVLKRFYDAFRADLPDHVDVLAIEDQFSSKDEDSLRLDRADLTNLDRTVDYILRTTLAIKGPTGGLPFKLLAFCKDLWSLFILWKLGGYHLDCGCFPHTSGKALSFPEPTTFGVVADSSGTGGNYQHAKVRFPSGTQCACLSVGLRAFSGLALAGATTPKGDAPRLNRMIDVWLLRSSADHKGARVALELYVQGWFATQAARLGEELHAQSLRELVVSSAATGITHSGHADGCFGETLWKTHLIDATFTPAVVPSMNLKKVGYGSHR